MQFVNISDDGLALFESLNCDPVMMAELGGPTPKARVPQILQNSVESVENGTCWYYKIIPDDSEEVAGTVCIWENTHHGESINEMGWTILPPFQGKGLGSKAVRAVLDKARAENRSGGRLIRGTRWRTQPRSGRTPSGCFATCTRPPGKRRGHDGGSLRVFKQFVWLEAGSVRMALSRPA